MEIKLGRKIGEGGHRIVYEIDQNTCAKVMKDKRVKGYLGLHVAYPMNFYNFFKFRTSDFNLLEFKNNQELIRQLPEEARQYFEQVYSVQTLEGKSVSICQLIRNTDNSVSHTLKVERTVKDKGFWEQIDYVKQTIIKFDLPFFGVHGKNILVQESDKGKKPVFIDFKRIGTQTFPFQPWIFIPGQSRRKINRSFDRLLQYCEN